MQRRAHTGLGAALGGSFPASSLEALAWVDVKTGAVLEACARDDVSRAALEGAALTAPQMCSAPQLDALPSVDVRAHETIVVSDAAVHVFVVSCSQPDRVVVGVAAPTANVALLLASLRVIADGEGE